MRCGACQTTIPIHSGDILRQATLRAAPAKKATARKRTAKTQSLHRTQGDSLFDRYGHLFPKARQAVAEGLDATFRRAATGSAEAEMRLFVKSR